jgi:hypothetical protein
MTAGVESPPSPPPSQDTITRKDVTTTENETAPATLEIIISTTINGEPYFLATIDNPEYDTTLEDENRFELDMADQVLYGMQIKLRAFDDFAFQIDSLPYTRSSNDGSLVFRGMLMARDRMCMFINALSLAFTQHVFSNHLEQRRSARNVALQWISAFEFLTCHKRRLATLRDIGAAPLRCDEDK